MTDERKIELDGLRGYAAIVVVICHSILGLDATQIERILRGQWSNLSLSESLTKLVLKIFDGETAVMLFFVLSGAVLFRSLMREDGEFGAVAVRFYIRRFFRIYPTLFVCLVACGLALAARASGATMNDFIANVLLYDFRINGATWTLNAEMIAPAFLLVCYAGYRMAREWGLVIAIVCLSGLLALLTEGYLISFKNSWYCFALGALIPTRLGQAAASALPRWLWLGAFFGAALLRWPLREACVAAIVLMVYYRRADAIQTFLSNRVSQFLGRISFSFYLFNVLFLEWMCDWLARQYPWVIEHTLVAGLGVALAVIVCTIPVAYLSWAWIEMPFNRLGHRLTGRGHVLPSGHPVVPS